jgi:pimeloyl-ACP methyl ester carboxylesterase
MTEWLEGDVYANGINIHYHRSDGSNKPSILLLHGFTDNGLCWSRVAHDLEDSYDVIMTDARGHGHSGGIATGFSTTILADDAAAVIRALGLEKPYLFGHSMGARTAATVAANYPDLVRAVVLEDPPLIDRPAAQTNEGQQGRQRWQWVFDLKALPREERIARGFTMNPNWAEEEIIPWADSKAEVHPDLLKRGAAIGSYPWREIIARIECPILLITGDPELGAIVTPEAAQEATQLWKNGEVVHISGAGHNIRRDRYDETMAAVRAFLNRT